MKRTVRWMLAVLVLIGIVFSIGLAGAEKGKTLEVRFTVPAEDMPRLRSGEGLTGDDAATATFSQGTGGSTCVAYTYAVNNGSTGGQVTQYRYVMGILDDFRPGQYTADTLYKSDLTTESELTYTFYQKGTYVLFVYRYDADGNTVSPVIYKRIYITQDSASNPLTAAVNSAAAECNKGNDFDTAVAISDYLAGLNTYDNSFTYYSPEAALLGVQVNGALKHTSVCNGYSRAYELIAKACGLECRRVTGNAGGGGHAWNAVKVNGNWYHIDPTWNDQSSQSFWHAYTLLNDGAISADHSAFDYPEGRVYCYTLADNYFIHEDKWTDLIPNGSGKPMANLQAALDAMTGTDGTITADYGTTVWLEGGGRAAGQNTGRLTINGNIAAYALSRTDLYKTGDATTPIRGSFWYTYNETDTPASKLTGEITAGTTDATRVQLTVPEGENGQLPAYTSYPITITMAPGATKYSFYDGEFWTMQLPTNQKSVTMDIGFPTAGEKTLMARAYYESADGTGEWVYSNAETRTFTAAEPLDPAEIYISSSNLNYGTQQGIILPVTFYEVEGADEYLFQVVNEEQQQVYESLRLYAEDLDELTGGRKGKIINVPTDGMPVGENGEANYAIRVYASATGREDSCSEALITVNRGTPASQAYLRVDTTEPLIGQNVVITAHVPGAAYVGVQCVKGDEPSPWFCFPTKGDTAMWTATFDWAGTGEYTLSAVGWTGEIWDENDMLTDPDLPATPVSVTVTVTAQQEEEVPEVDISIPSPLTADSTITVSFDAFPGATTYTVNCEEEFTCDTVYYQSSAEPFTAEIPAAWLRTDKTYRLDVEVCRVGYYNYQTQFQLVRSDFDGAGFTIALDGVSLNADGTYHVNTNEDYTLVCTGLPEGVTDIAVLMYGDAWYENEVNANGQATIQIWEPGTGIPLMACYEDGNRVTHYSNLLTLTAAENTACPHTKYEFVWDNISEPVYEEIEGNNQDHKVTRVLGEFMQCTLCGENLGRTDTPAETEETVEQHEYDENGVCTLCRHVNTCEHAECHELIWVYPNENEVIHRYDEEGFEADDLQHMVSGDGFTYQECGDCGMTFNRQDLPGTTTVGKPHHYVNGVCDECGYGCSHSVMEEESEFDHYAYYTKNGDEHITVPVYAVTHFCNACGYSDPDEEPVYTAEWGGVTEAHEDGDEDGLCDLCGASMEQSWSWDFVNGNTLILSGSGTVDGFDTLNDLPWSHVPEIGNTKRVIIEDGITGLGKNVLAGFKDGIRVDFYTKAQPATTADTFGGKEVVCRYYDNTNTWDGTAGGETVTWIYLPVREGGDCFALAYYQEDGKDAPTWHLRENVGASSAQDVEIDRAAAMEYSQEQIAVILDAIPTIASGDRAVIENRNISTVAVFNTGCTGSYTMDFSAFPNIDVQLDIDAPNLALTIIGPTGETDPLFSMDVHSAKGITCNWDIADLRLRRSQEGQPTDVYVDGDVEKLSYYDATSDMPFIGTLTVTGRIISGTVYGQNELQVPGVTLNGTPVRFGSLDTATFTYENEAATPALEQVIEYVQAEQKSRLNPDVDREDIGDLRMDMFKLTYQYWGPGRVAFGVDPKEETGLGGMGGYIDNILEADYNPSFTTDDIIWGDDTTVYFMDTGETAYTLNGGTDGSGNRAGVGAMYLQNCNVTVNCPAGFIKTWQYKNDLGPVNLTINDTVKKAEVMFFRDGGRIHLGPNGAILEGVWDRGIRGYREIGTVRGECDYAVDGTLRVLSAKDGQRTKAIPASDKAVTTAAGLSGQRTAVMDVNDATVAPEETGVLNEYLAAHNLTSQDVVNVFDVSVTAYSVDEQGYAMGKIGDISQLNKGVLVAVGNDSGEAVSVVRLHEDENGVLTAERLTGSVSGAKVQFTSDLFSTYVLVKGDTELDPANLTKLTLPASLKRIEESAFEGIAAQAVIVPRGCEYIGSKAFKDCPNLVYIEYYEGTEVESDAFAECNSLQIKVIPVQ